MKFVLLFFILFALVFVRADEVRSTNSFKSKNGEYELRLRTKYPEKQRWALIHRRTNRTLYKVSEWLESMTVVVSNDGRKLIAIDDFSVFFRKDNPLVLRFYLDGKLIKSYKLDQLLINPTNVTQSVSHFQWLLDFPQKITSTEELSLTTNELVTYKFSLSNGNILQRKQDERLTGNAIYAFGKITKLKNETYEMDVLCLIYGKIPDNRKIIFKTAPNSILSNSYYDSLIVKNGELIAKINLSLNVCVEK
jgi:hypothetical protein